MASQALLLTDSPPLARSLSGGYFQCNGDMLSLWNFLTRALQSGMRISVVWIPGHVGIQYNERADELATQSLKLWNSSAPRQPGHVHVQQVSREQKALFWSHLCHRQRVQALVHEGGRSGMACQVLTVVSRALERMVVQIRTQCCYRFGVIKHNHAAGTVELHVCNLCGCVQTINHVLFHCPCWSEARREDIDEHTSAIALACQAIGALDFSSTSISAEEYLQLSAAKQEQQQQRQLHRPVAALPSQSCE